MNRYIKKCPLVKLETNSLQARWRNDFAQWTIAGLLAVSIIGHFLPSIAIAATVQGIAFIDFNDNGVIDSCELPHANATVFIMDNVMVDAGQGGFFTAITDANGHYKSTAHHTGSFSIWSDIPPGLKQSMPEIEEGTVMHNFTIAGYNETVTINFGFFKANNSQNQPPTITVPSTTITVDMDSNVSLNATASDPEGDSICAVNLDFGDDNTANSLETNHIYTEPETYTVTINVMDVKGATGTATVTVIVKNVLPTVNFVANSNTISICDKAVFTGKVTDTVSDELTHLLDFGDGNTVNASSANHTYQSQGTYTVTLTSTDSFGGVGKESVTVTVNNTTPTIEMQEEMTTTVNQVTHFAGNLIDSDSCDTHTFNWDFGDGNTADTLNASHTYTKMGEYTATLIVTDKFGEVSTNSLKVTVADLPPVVEIISY